MTPKVSIIVPAYNAEKYVKICLDSLVQQTLKPIEIIVVNDGSKDHTQTLLMEYANQYDFIKVIEQTNQGVSMTRNRALNQATGEYIGFVDIDDYVEIDMFEKLYQKAKKENLDMVCCDVVAHYPDHLQTIASGVEDGQSTKKLLIDAYAVLWNKLFRRECIQSLRFKAGVWYEDVLYLYQAYIALHKVGSVKETLYHYMQNDNSITYTYNDKLFDLLDNLEDILQYYKDKQVYEQYHDELEYMYVRYSFATFFKRLSKSKNHRKYRVAYKQVIGHVKQIFPAYKQNKYLKQGLKGLYLKHFCLITAELIYLLEKNKMN